MLYSIKKDDLEKIIPNMKTEDEKVSQKNEKINNIQMFIITFFIENMHLFESNIDNVTHSKQEEYKFNVLDILKDNRDSIDMSNPKLLHDLQMRIEELTIKFDTDKNIQQMSPDLINIFIDK